MNKKVFISSVALGVIMASAGLTKASAADLDANAHINVGMKGGPAVQAVVRGAATVRDGKGVFGTVTAINGNTITLQSKGMGNPSSASGQATTTFTIDASNAAIKKDNASSTVSSIAVGDSIFAQGTISGTSVTATEINDGKVTARVGNMQDEFAQLEGNGQPIIGGKVTAVNGNTITITNKSNVSYTVDATSAKLTKTGKAITASSIAVNDQILVQGTINGTSVTATTIIDGGANAVLPDTANAHAQANAQAHVGVFAKIGSFFKHLFGF